MLAMCGLVASCTLAGESPYMRIPGEETRADAGPRDARSGGDAEADALDVVDARPPRDADDVAASPDGRGDAAPEADGGGAPPVRWEEDVRPLLQAKGCTANACHGVAQAAELDATTVEGLRQGGEHGPAVVPCEPGAGELLPKVRPDPPYGERMPNDEDLSPLTAAQIELLRRWIAQGARSTPDPGACDEG